MLPSSPLKTYNSHSYAGDTMVRDGNCKFPFEIQLGPRLPTSYEGTYGYIRYILSLHVECAVQTLEPLEELFTIIKPLNLNNSSSSYQVRFWAYQIDARVLISDDFSTYFLDANGSAKVCQVQWVLVGMLLQIRWFDNSRTLAGARILSWSVNQFEIERREQEFRGHFTFSSFIRSSKPRDKVN